MAGGRTGVTGRLGWEDDAQEAADHQCRQTDEDRLFGLSPYPLDVCIHFLLLYYKTIILSIQQEPLKPGMERDNVVSRWYASSEWSSIASPMKRRFTEDAWRKEPWFRSLCAAFRSCKTDDDLANFLRDVGTLSELQAWSERLEVARLIGKGYSYRQVAKETGASTTTVTRVAHFLENGEGGYRAVLKVHRHHRMLPKPASAPQPASPKADPPAEKPEPKPVTALQKYL